MSNDRSFGLGKQFHKWTVREDKILLSMLVAKASLEEMCKHFDRTVGAIQTRLTYLRRLHQIAKDSKERPPGLERFPSERPPGRPVRDFSRTGSPVGEVDAIAVPAGDPLLALLKASGRDKM